VSYCVAGSDIDPLSTYDTPGRVIAFWDQLQRRLEALPGVSRIAFADSRPPNGAGNFNNFDLEDFPTAAGQSQPVTPWVSVSPDYFRLLGLSLLDGRLLEDRDGAAANLESVVVDRAWARRFFPKQSAVGKRFHEGGCTTCPWTTVVGVVSEVKYAGLDKPDDGTVYTAMPAQGSSSPARVRFVLARTDVDAISLASSVRQIVRELDPSVPLSGLATFDDLVDQSLLRPRSMSILVGGFAAVALMLSLVGIYGVMAHYVQQQTKDISIRLALGGRPAHVLGLIVREGMKVVTGGVAVGLAHLEGYCVEKNGLSAYYWLRVAEENSCELGHRSHALVEQLRRTVKTDELENLEHNVSVAVKNNKLLSSRRPVEFIKRRADSSPLRIAI
jgi:hypothetical protein